METATISGSALQNTAPPDRVELASSRARIYGILSAVCGGQPGADVLRLISGWGSQTVLLQELPPGMRRGLQRMSAWVAANAGDPAQLGTLDTEFTRLFRGLGRTHSPPPPFESVYVDGGLLYGPTTQEVAAAYRRYDVAGRQNEPPDYIALELDFMRLLCDREACAWQDGGVYYALLMDESDFLSRHLLTWVPDFCRNVRRAKTSAFYTGLADAVEGWLKCDRRILKGLLKITSG